MNENSLVQKISKKFVPENKVIETPFEAMGENFSLFYIEGLINKQLFSAGLLMPIEKFVKQNKQNTPSNKSKNQSQNSNLNKCISAQNGRFEWKSVKIAGIHR